MAFIINSIKKARNWWVDFRRDYIINPTINYVINPTINYVIKPCIIAYVRLWQFVFLWVILFYPVILSLITSIIMIEDKARKRQQDEDIEKYGHLVRWNSDLY
tara:strand:+ start:219 stop:527 length:309 start_codon:yes stop_codon:yes gene_type:complete